MVANTNLNSASHIYPADINNDGLVDAIVTGNGVLTYLENLGSTSFQSRAITTSLTGPLVAGVGDLNKDGYLDLVVASSTLNRVEVYIHRGSAATPTATFNSGTPLGALVRNPQEVLLTDFDNDRDLDVVIASRDDNSVHIIYSGCCTAGVRCANQCPNGLVFTSAAIVPLLSRASSVAVADLNGDGTNELVVGGQNVYVVVQPSVISNPWTLLTVGSTNANAVFSSVALVDIRGKGRLDIVATDSVNSVVLSVINRNDLRFTARTLTTEISSPLSARVADINGDGLPDVVFASVAGTTVVADINNQHTLKRIVSGFAAADVAIADIDNDGDVDVCVGKGCGRRALARDHFDFFFSKRCSLSFLHSLSFSLFSSPHNPLASSPSSSLPILPALQCIWLTTIAVV